METRTGRLDKRLFEPCCDNLDHTMARHHSQSPKRWPASLRFALAICLALGLTWPGADDMAHAGDGDIEGKVVVKPNKLGSPPLRNQGFLERIENPLRPIRKFNPWPYMYAVLTDGPIDDEAKKPPGGKVRYHLVGESFEKPLLAVIVNTRVELVNSTTREVTLFTPDDAAMEEAHTFNPRGMSDFKVTEAGDSIVIRSQDTNHLQGRVVAFPSRYFVRVNRRGKFEFKDVPEGNWKVRIWYRDGWLDAPEQSVEVEKRRTADVAVTISPDKVRNTK